MGTILICDDDIAILEVTKTILEVAGYTVKTSVTCNNIINLVQDADPDLILMDLWIPDAGGEEATNRIKANNSTKEIPVILFSANNDIEKIAAKTNAEGYLKKPYEIEQLESIVSTNIKKRARQ